MMAPFVHEFTYQAMANDLLPIEDGTKYTSALAIDLFSQKSDEYSFRYKFQSSVGTYEDKVATLSDADTTYTSVRHLHMREAIDKLMSDFNKFLEDNAVFNGFVPRVDNIYSRHTDHLQGRCCQPERHEGHASVSSTISRTSREGKLRLQGRNEKSIMSSMQFSLHLTIAQDCMDIFEKQKLSDIASVEQVGLDLLRGGLVKASFSAALQV